MKEPQRLPKAGLNVEEFIGGAKTAAVDAAPANGKARKKKGLPAEGVVRATYDLPASVHEALKIRAVQEKRSMRELFTPPGRRRDVRYPGKSATEDEIRQ